MVELSEHFDSFILYREQSYSYSKVLIKFEMMGKGDNTQSIDYGRCRCKEKIFLASEVAKKIVRWI